MDLFQLVGTQEYFSKLCSKYTCVNTQQSHTHTHSTCHLGKLFRSAWQKDSVTVSVFRVSVWKSVSVQLAEWQLPRWSYGVTGGLNHHRAHAASSSLIENHTIIQFSYTHGLFSDRPRVLRASSNLLNQSTSCSVCVFQKDKDGDKGCCSLKAP